MTQNYPTLNMGRLTNPYFKSFYLFVFLLVSAFSFGQTTHISPTGDGGFANGATFALNGWTATTSATTTNNQWVCNTGATRSEEHTSELQSRENLVCRLLLE